MIVKQILFHRNNLLVILFLVLIVNITLYHTSLGVRILPENSNGVVVGSIIDVALITPFLFIAWTKQWNVKSIILAIATGLVLVRFLIPIDYLKPFVAVTWAGFLIEAGIIAIEIFILFLLIKYIPTIIRFVKANSLPTVFSFPNVIDQHIKSTPFIKIICTEILMFYYAFASWRKKQEVYPFTFTLHRNSSLIATQIMLIHSIVLETIVIHWWIHERFAILSIILLLLNIYSVIFLIGNLQAIRHNPIHMNGKNIYISFGLMKRIKIDLENIEKIMDDPEVLERKRSKNTIDFISRDFENASPQLILKLRKPTKAIMLLGKEKEYEFVAIRLDEPVRFKNELLKRLDQFK